MVKKIITKNFEIYNSNPLNYSSVVSLLNFCEDPTREKVFSMKSPGEQGFPILSIVNSPFQRIFQNIYKDALATVTVLDYSLHTLFQALLIASHFMVNDAFGKDVISEEYVLSLSRASVLIASKMYENNIKFRGLSYLETTRGRQRLL